MAKIFCMIGGTLILAVLMMILLMLTAGCTYSINLVDTHGEASNVVDERDNIDPTIDPTLSVPGGI